MRRASCGSPRDFNQAAALQSGDDAAHGGRLDLLGGGEFAERFRAGEDQDRQRGELRGADAGSDILLAHAAQQVDGGGMKAVGGGDAFRPGRDSSGLGVSGLTFCLAFLT